MWPLLLQDPSASIDSISSALNSSLAALRREGVLGSELEDSKLVASHAGSPFYLTHLSEPSNSP